jgi:hypothetical protein
MGFYCKGPTYKQSDVAKGRRGFSAQTGSQTAEGFKTFSYAGSAM